MADEHGGSKARAYTNARDLLRSGHNTLMSSKWTELSERLVAVLQLTTPPVAISFVDVPPMGVERFDDPMSAPTADGRRGRAPAGCVFWGLGAERAFSTLAEDHGNCTVGSITQGLLDPSEAVGREDVAELVGAGWVGSTVLDELPRVSKRPGSIVYAPLGTTTVDPDVVLLRADGRQMMILSDALPELSVHGKPQCGIVALTKEDGVAAASFGCALSRERTRMRPEEMTCTLPAARLEPVVEALERAATINEVVALYAADDARRFVKEQ